MATEHSNTELRSQEQNVLAFQQLEDYAWQSDTEFQSGLQAILGSNPSAEQAEHLTLRARCFYLSRKSNIPLDYDAYQTWRSQQSYSPANGISVMASAFNPSVVSNSLPKVDPTSRNGMNTTPKVKEPPAPYPTSFSQIVELITSGDPIPGMKDVPDTVLEGQASQSTTAKRKKPWEKDEAGAGAGESEEVVGANNLVANN